MKHNWSSPLVFVFSAILMCCGQVMAQEKNHPYYNDLNEFTLDEAEGFRTLSSFYSSGSQWCSHPYVRVVVEYENKAIRKSVLTSNPANYLQQTIIPEIKKICPKFPHAAKYHKQVIDFRFRPKRGGIADERINPDKLGFQIDDQGNVSLIKDIAYRNWSDTNKGSYAFEQDQHADKDDRLLITGAEKLANIVNSATQKLEKLLQNALQRRDDYKLFFAKTANPKFFEALNLNEDAIANFKYALIQNKKARSSVNNAKSIYNDPSDTNASLEKAKTYIDEYQQYREQANAFEETALDKFLEGDKKFKEGYQDHMKQKEQKMK
ncbi:hypothetical protein [Methylophaga nitratireducenticrescens]|uniref:Uncharacterized protein n=1 Tax=Methylophaga nitratireducenticrescens TaxID=754476 RepID=I1XGU9_METNJ|nr:hypothetical protein [Methylophaga nitratireducenticrescens]AFI83618.1 hypothetical protein Q7A_773 [Methylophaga nitratireducenticrescens]AUZ83675.1 hypothetical protein CDW43_03400 [Methylophaga nitratireducenticrescens]